MKEAIDILQHLVKNHCLIPLIQPAIKLVSFVVKKLLKKK